MRALTLTQDMADLFNRELLTRLPILARSGEYFEATGPDSGRLMTAARTPYLATDEAVRIHTPLQKDVCQARFTGLAGSTTMSRFVFDISDTELRFYGETRLTDLWMRWAERYDPTAAWWWQGCEGLIDLPVRTRIFRKFLKTRPQDPYRAWVLMLQPIHEVIHEHVG